MRRRRRRLSAADLACFDTGFHKDLPDVARRLPFPRQVHDAGIHRYGFHGLSYEYVVDAIGGGSLGRAVLAHLGSGASMAAVDGARCVDTTMGATPCGGLMMGTRPGDVDPGAVRQVAEHFGLAGKDLDAVLNERCGLLGVSETSSDMRQLLRARDHDPLAALAVDMFCYIARKTIGAYAAALGGLDTLVFTGGIGARSSEVRRRICGGLEHLGVKLDAVLNARGEGLVGSKSGACRVRVVKTDEERMIARHVRRTLAPS